MIEEAENDCGINENEHKMKKCKSENLEKNALCEITIDDEQNAIVSQQNVNEVVIENDNAVSDCESDTKIFEKAEWQGNVEKFLTAYPNAQEWTSEIGKVVVEDEMLCKDEQCLEKAFLKVLCREYQSPQDIINDQNFRENFVLNNREIREIIIDNYLENLVGSKPPKTISARGQIALAPASKPKNIDEAGKVFNMMFKNRRM
ncbi:MAG: hypothetical protein RR348_03130 [Clostridia bacterium]